MHKNKTKNNNSREQQKPKLSLATLFTQENNNEKRTSGDIWTH